MAETPAAGVAQPPMVRPDGDGGTVMIDNRTELPDNEVRDAIMAQWTETASLQFGSPSSFQLYATNPNGNMLTRSPFRTPSNVIDEIKLARHVADTDDDVAAVIGQAIATAFGDGMENLHEDERTVLLFNKICGPLKNGGMNMDRLLKELYREYLIASQFTTISLYTRTRYKDVKGGPAQLATPLVGVIPSENIRVLSNDLFGDGDLAYDVTDVAMKEWLDEFFAETTTAARREAMRRAEPVTAAIFTGVVEVPWDDQDPFSSGKKLYKLNPRMVDRTTMAKGASAYPRPLLTANFALLEAKRLLNIMDYALLQGGTNYIVIAKQGSDAHPAQQPEIDNLTDQVRLASRTGVLVGDHRLSVDIITPQLTELLNPEKRKLLGRKLAMMLLRIPEQVTGDAGSEGAKQELEFTARTISSDRHDVLRHVEGNVYAEIVTRNPSSFSKGSPSIWCPRIILSGVKDFYDQVTKARDRGDIPRRWAVELLGYNYDAGVAEREREKERGDDEILTPGAVPFQGDQGGDGRPPGSSSNNGGGGDGPPPDPAQRQRQGRPGLPPGVNAAEEVRAAWDGERTIRVGVLTERVLEEFPGHTVGRMTSIEREAVEASEIRQSGPVVVVPVNLPYRATEVRAFRLAEGLSMIVGQREGDGALIAKALCFREPHFDLAQAQETAMRWGFVTSVHEAPPELTPAPPEAPPPTPAQQLVTAALENPALLEVAAQAFAKAIGGLVPAITIQMPGEEPKEIIRDERGAIIGTRPIPRAE